MTPEAAKNLMSCSENLFLKQALSGVQVAV